LLRIPSAFDGDARESSFLHGLIAPEANVSEMGLRR
jgi:hypothetical protein